MQKELQTYVDELFTDISPTAKSEAVKNELLQRMQNKYDQYVKTGMGEETAYKKVVDSVEEISELDIDLNQIQFSVNHEHERDEIYSQKEYKANDVLFTFLRDWALSTCNSCSSGDSFSWWRTFNDLGCCYSDELGGFISYDL